MIENLELYAEVNVGEKLIIDLPNCKIITETLKEFQFVKIPEKILQMIQNGGLVNFYKRYNQAGIH
ncbi:MAG: hypothetical protein AB1422_00305 [bacterium]